MSSPVTKSPYAGYRFPAEVISHAVWLYFRFPLSLLSSATRNPSGGATENQSTPLW